MTILTTAYRGFSKQSIGLVCFLLFCSTHFGFAQTMHIQGNTPISGLQLVHTKEAALRPIFIQKETAAFYIKAHTVFHSIEKLNTPLVFAENQNTGHVTFKVKNQKQKLKFAPTKQPTQAAAIAKGAAITALPFSGDYPFRQYNIFASAAVIAPSTPNFYKVVLHPSATGYHTRQLQLEAGALINTFLGYSNPFVATIIPIALSNRPPPFLG